MASSDFFLLFKEFIQLNRIYFVHLSNHSKFRQVYINRQNDKSECLQLLLLFMKQESLAFKKLKNWINYGGLNQAVENEFIGRGKCEAEKISQRNFKSLTHTHSEISVRRVKLNKWFPSWCPLGESMVVGRMGLWWAQKENEMTTTWLDFQWTLKHDYTFRASSLISSLIRLITARKGGTGADAASPWSRLDFYFLTDSLSIW